MVVLAEDRYKGVSAVINSNLAIHAKKYNKKYFYTYTSIYRTFISKQQLTCAGGHTGFGVPFADPQTLGIGVWWPAAVVYSKMMPLM